LGAGDLAVPTNCTIYAYSHGTNGGSMKFRCTNLRIDQGGQVNADAAGFANGDSVHQNGYGPGFGYRGANSGGGGGYGGGGQQGNHTGSYPGTTYGSATNPVLPGSGGGDYRATSTTRGCGGGLIWIDVSNRALLNGTLSANGGAPSGYEAAGSGGGIYVRCKRFNGTATGWMQANGGNGGSESGGGGGGRIAVWSQFLDWPFTNNVAVNPGTAVGGYIPVATLGTVYYGQLPIDRGVVFTIQ